MRLQYVRTSISFVRYFTIHFAKPKGPAPFFLNAVVISYKWSNEYVSSQNLSFE